MEINETKFDLNTSKLVSNSGCFSPNNQDDNDIIILDDDDFIQTTFNLFNSSENTHTNLDIDLNQQDTSNHQNNHIVIDLTTCDDFDLNDIFLLNSNQNLNFSPAQNQQINTNETFLKIKNEFDFKNCQNFNFSNNIEEILIDDEDENNLEQVENENDDENVIEQEILSSLANKTHKNLNFININPTNSFLNYRTNDSSSEASSSQQTIKNRQFKCDKCSKFFNKSYNLKRHLFLHQVKSNEIDDDTQFSINDCPNCKKRILDKSNYAKHLKICHQKGAKKFKQQQQQQLQNDSTIQRQNSKKKILKFECENCAKVFNKKFNYHRHIRMHFLNEIMNHQHEPMEMTENLLNTMNDLNRIKIEIFECDKCFRKFTTHKQLVTHQTKWHQTEYVCNICEQRTSFMEKFDYIKHLNMFHSIRFKFECKYCKKTFRFISQFIQHKKTHLKQTEFLNLNEKNDSEEDRDILMQELNQLYKCDKCGKTFSKLFNLKRHVNTLHASCKQTNQFESNINDNIHNLDSNNFNPRLKYDCNLNQRSFYERNKLNFHLNKIDLSKNC